MNMKWRNPHEKRLLNGIFTILIESLILQFMRMKIILSQTIFLNQRQ